MKAFFAFLKRITFFELFQSLELLQILELFQRAKTLKT